MNKLLQGIKKINSIDFSKEQIINFLLHIVVIIVPFIIFDFDLLGTNKDVSKGHSQYLEGKVFFFITYWYFINNIRNNDIKENKFT